MSTRSEIFGPDGRGRYHHFDGYPSGVGATLWELYRHVFECNIGEMRKVLIDDHPAGWSTINVSVEGWKARKPGYVDISRNYKCSRKGCGKPHDEHYFQYLPQEAQDKMRAEGFDPAKQGYALLGHSPVVPPDLQKVWDETPKCYCHGQRSEAEDQRMATLGTWDDGSLFLLSDINEEYAYILDDDALYVYASPHRLLGVFRWDEAEPNWKSLA
jgi:hypothetical protein